eukprot:1476887-Prymnesium_polylepis.1
MVPRRASTSRKSRGETSLDRTGLGRRDVREHRHRRHAGEPRHLSAVHAATSMVRVHHYIRTL